MEGSTNVTELLTTLPIEYWETECSIHGALVSNVSADGLLILSVRNMPIGITLNVRIYYAKGYELDQIEVVAKITCKRLHITEDWRGYNYILEFLHVSEEERRKLESLFDGHPKWQDISTGENLVLRNLWPEEMGTPPEPDLDLTMLPTANCDSYKNGKCARTGAFCDLCGEKVETNVGQRSRTIRKPRNHRLSPFTPVLSKLADNFSSPLPND